MFKLDQSPTFAWPVTVQIPVDGGAYTTETFDAHFKRMPASEIEALQRKVMAGELSDATLVKLIMAGWGGVTDGGADVPFTPASLDRLLEIRGTARAIIAAFVASQQDAPRKN